jgi:type I restriction enzyme S subunit
MSEWKELSFGSIPNEWNFDTFQNALKIKGRIGWKGYKTSDLRDHGPVVIGGTNIKSNIYLDYSTLTHLSREKYEESPEIMLKKGDVILVTRGNGIGDVGLYNGEYQEATINPSIVILTDFVGNSKIFILFFSVTTR